MILKQPCGDGLGCVVLETITCAAVEGSQNAGVVCLDIEWVLCCAVGIGGVEDIDWLCTGIDENMHKG